MITMYDTDSGPEVIPSDAQAVAGYADGGNFAAIAAAFPHAHHLSIATNGGVDADALDIETGDVNPGEAPTWFRRQKARGSWKPCFYIEASRRDELVGVLERAGISRSEYRLWIAAWNGVPHIEPGADATQYEDHGERYDVSLCWDEFFNVTPPPPPVPPYQPGDEHNWCVEWDRILPLKPLRYHLRRIFLKNLMVHRERLIVKLATSQKDGWDKLNRKYRYEQLYKRTKER